MDEMERCFHASPLRVGTWTEEERRYMYALMEEFKDGSLDLEDGATMRCFLAKQLHCGVKRISKKMEGSDYKGRHSFARQLDMPEEEVTARRDKLRLLRQQFLASLQKLRLPGSQAYLEEQAKKKAAEAPAPVALPPAPVALPPAAAVVDLVAQKRRSSSPSPTERTAQRLEKEARERSTLLGAIASATGGDGFDDDDFGFGPPAAQPQQEMLQSPTATVAAASVTNRLFPAAENRNSLAQNGNNDALAALLEAKFPARTLAQLPQGLSPSVATELLQQQQSHSQRALLQQQQSPSQRALMAANSASASRLMPETPTPQNTSLAALLEAHRANGKQLASLGLTTTTNPTTTGITGSAAAASLGLFNNSSSSSLSVADDLVFRTRATAAPIPSANQTKKSFNPILGTAQSAAQDRFQMGMATALPTEQFGLGGGGGNTNQGLLWNSPAAAAAPSLRNNNAALQGLAGLAPPFGSNTNNNVGNLLQSTMPAAAALNNGGNPMLQNAQAMRLSILNSSLGVRGAASDLEEPSAKRFRPSNFPLYR